MCFDNNKPSADNTENKDKRLHKNLNIVGHIVNKWLKVLLVVVNTSCVIEMIIVNPGINRWANK